MNTEITIEITQSLKYYIDKDMSGAELSKTIKRNFEKAEGLSKNHERSFRYYIDFFEKEGSNLYLDSNVYLKEEVNELVEFVSGLDAD